MRLNIEIDKIDFATANAILKGINGNMTSDATITATLDSNVVNTTFSDTDTAFARYLSRKPSDEE